MYTFQVAKDIVTDVNASFSQQMSDACAAHGMKPICYHPSYCDTDSAALYLGQLGHLTNGDHRNSTVIECGCNAAYRQCAAALPLARVLMNAESREAVAAPLPD